uniref:GRIP domain-containing protein n=2 Tax=Scylla olivacea TaxID=85551 RepID=A0A0P4W162_SCYOL
MDDSYISLGDLGDMTLGGGVSSLPYCGSTLEEERPGSSLSNASRSSKIPVFTRSHSLRVKSSSGAAHSQEGAKASSKTGVKGRADARPGSRASPSVGKGLVRSASFVSSRGMKGVSSPPSLSSTHPPSHHPASRHSLTPETPRRASYSANHAKRPSGSATDRKSHSYAGMGGSWYHHHSPSSYFHNHGLLNHHHVSRRPNFLPVSAASSSSQFSSLPTTPASQPETPSRSPDSNEPDDADSVKSFGSVSSAVSCDAALTHHHRGQACGGPGGASKGGRSFKYVLHCRHNHDHDPEQYLTPTQRAARRIRELKSQLSEARREVQQRDTEIARLTRELVELRLLKARNPHWEDEEDEAEGEDGRREDKVDGKDEGVVAPPPASRTHADGNARATSKTSSTPSEGSEPELRRLMENVSSGAPDSTVPQEPPAASPASGSVAETRADSVDLTRSSLADSGHYDDLTSPSLSSRDPLETSRGSLRGHHTEEEEEVGAEEEEKDDREGVLQEVVVEGSSGEPVDPWAALEEAEARIREEYQRREELLKRNHMEDYNELKEKYNDRVEVLLSKLSDANLKYFELRPLYDQSQERVRELERDVMRLKEELTEAELRHQKMYLQMFLKGQQAARIQAEDDLDGGEEGLPSSLTSSGPMMELMRQLTRTEEELEKVKALYHREINCRNNNNNSTGGRRNGELDPEVTLQFLKSAIYYFFTDRDNAKGHLRAIESILGYSDSERYNIGKVIK